jgi:molybdate transport system substrate-binding protein
MRRLLVPAATAGLALAASGCGGSSSSGGTITVDAAASLTNVLTILSKTFEKQHPGWKVELNFAGSNQLASEIAEGQKADVFASASPKWVTYLQGKKLLGSTKIFASNHLVIAVPASNPAGITNVGQLVSKHPSMVVAAPAVPLGGDTQQLFENLGIPMSKLHIVDQGTNAEEVLAELTTGNADAGVVYYTDALSAGSKLKTIPFPPKAQASNVYPMGILTGTSHKQAAQWWVNLIFGPTGQTEFKKLGFGAPPSS